MVNLKKSEELFKDIEERLVKVEKLTKDIDVRTCKHDYEYCITYASWYPFYKQICTKCGDIVYMCETGWIEGKKQKEIDDAKKVLKDNDYEITD